MNALLAENLAKTYRLPGGAPIRVLDGVSLSVAPGEHVAILGKSGSGKSTLLNLLGGLDRPDPGCGARIEVAGCDLVRAGERARARLRASKIGFVFQSFHLMPELTIVENVRLPALALGAAARRGATERARELLRAAGLGDRLDHRPAELSGGEQQRVAVARALMNGPEILLADEPTGNLDASTGMQILDLVFDLGGAFSSAPPALAMVTHSDAIAARCDRTLRLEAGRLVG
jgi:putative ABC transport system ATP-binding protein